MVGAPAASAASVVDRLGKIAGVSARGRRHAAAGEGGIGEF